MLSGFTYLPFVVYLLIILCTYSFKISFSVLLLSEYLQITLNFTRKFINFYLYAIYYLVN